MCLYGAETTVRLKQLGMEFAVWTFKHATEASLSSVAAFTFKQLLSLLDEGALIFALLTLTTCRQERHSCFITPSLSVYRCSPHLIRTVADTVWVRDSVTYGVQSSSHVQWQ